MRIKYLLSWTILSSLALASDPIFCTERVDFKETSNHQERAKLCSDEVFRQIGADPDNDWPHYIASSEGKIPGSGYIFASIQEPCWLDNVQHQFATDATRNEDYKDVYFDYTYQIEHGKGDDKNNCPKTNAKNYFFAFDRTDDPSKIYDGYHIATDFPTLGGGTIFEGTAQVFETFRNTAFDTQKNILGNEPIEYDVFLSPCSRFSRDGKCYPIYQPISKEKMGKSYTEDLGYIKGKSGVEPDKETEIYFAKLVDKEGNFPFHITEAWALEEEQAQNDANNQELPKRKWVKFAPEAHFTQTQSSRRFKNTQTKGAYVSLINHNNPQGFWLNFKPTIILPLVSDKCRNDVIYKVEPTSYGSGKSKSYSPITIEGKNPTGNNRLPTVYYRNDTRVSCSESGFMPYIYNHSKVKNLRLAPDGKCKGKWDHNIAFTHEFEEKDLMKNPKPFYIKVHGVGGLKDCTALQKREVKPNVYTAYRPDDPTKTTVDRYAFAKSLGSSPTTGNVFSYKPGVLTRISGDSIALAFDLRNLGIDKNINILAIDTGANNAHIYWDNNEASRISLADEDQIKKQLKLKSPTLKLFDISSWTSNPDHNILSGADSYYHMPIVFIENIKTTDKQAMEFSLQLLNKLQNDDEIAISSIYNIAHDKLSVRVKNFNLKETDKYGYIQTKTLKLEHINKADEINSINLSNELANEQSLISDIAAHKGQYYLQGNAYKFTSLLNKKTYEFYDTAPSSWVAHTDKKVDSRIGFFAKPYKAQIALLDKTMNQYYGSESEAAKHCNTAVEFDERTANMLDANGMISCGVPAIMNLNFSQEPALSTAIAMDKYGRTNALFANNVHFAMISDFRFGMPNSSAFEVEHDEVIDLNLPTNVGNASLKRLDCKGDDYACSCMEQTGPNACGVMDVTQNIHFSAQEINQAFENKMDEICQKYHCKLDGILQGSEDLEKIYTDKNPRRASLFFLGDLNRPKLNINEDSFDYSLDDNNNRITMWLNYFSSERIKEQDFSLGGSSYKMIEPKLVFKDKTLNNHTVSINEEDAILYYLNANGENTNIDLKGTSGIYYKTVPEIGRPGFENNPALRARLVSTYNNKLSENANNWQYHEKANSDGSYSSYTKDTINCLGQYFACESFSIESQK